MTGEAMISNEDLENKYKSTRNSLIVVNVFGLFILGYVVYYRADHGNEPSVWAIVGMVAAVAIFDAIFLAILSGVRSKIKKHFSE